MITDFAYFLVQIHAPTGQGSLVGATSCDDYGLAMLRGLYEHVSHIENVVLVERDAAKRLVPAAFEEPSDVR